MNAQGNLTVKLEGRGTITLKTTDHMATGGEGTIYKVNDTVIKIYHKIDTVARNDVEGKIAFFKQHPHPYVIAPIGGVYEGTKLIGFYMPLAPGDYLTRVFTTGFRKTIGFKDADSILLTDRMRDIVLFAHSNNALLVDANEFGYLVAPGPEPRIIDVDSWVLYGKLPATVSIMPSIHDWHVKTIGQQTDWFAYAIVTFQVYTGLHPYKGVLDGYTVRDLELRMKDNASVFSKGIQLNMSVRDFNCIPGPLLDWYKSTFQDGTREIPPSPTETGVAMTQTGRILHTQVTVTGNLTLEKLYEKPGEEILRVFPCGMVLTDAGTLYDLKSKRVIYKDALLDCKVIKVEGGWLVVRKAHASSTNYVYINEIDLSASYIEGFVLQWSQLLLYENRLFVVTIDKLIELQLRVFNRILLTGKPVCSIMPKSTTWFDGVGVQDALGATYLVTPFGDDSCISVRVKELDTIKLVNAKAGEHFVTVVGLNNKGEYEKFEIIFDKTYSSYKIWSTITDSPDLNIAILPKGVCSTIVRDGEVTLFAPSQGTTKTIQDSQIRTDMLLYNWENKVLYIYKSTVWQMSLK